MAKGKAASPHRKARQAENHPKAIQRKADRIKANKGQNVSPKTFNGHTVDGYTPARAEARRVARLAVLESDQ